MTYQTLRSRVKELREARNMGQDDIAAAIQVSRTTVQNWESGKGLEQIERLLLLCKFLRCDLEDLIEYVPTDEPPAKGKRRRTIEQVEQLSSVYLGEPTGDALTGAEKS